MRRWRLYKNSYRGAIRFLHYVLFIRVLLLTESEFLFSYYSYSFINFQSDKASMLDEAIEYLKSLQMQVQVIFVDILFSRIGNLSSILIVWSFSMINRFLHIVLFISLVLQIGKVYWKYISQNEDWLSQTG